MPTTNRPSSLPGRHRTRRRLWLFLLGRTAWFGSGVLALLLLNSLWALASPGLEKGELVILSGDDDSVGRQRQHLLDEWNQQHPNNHASQELVSDNADSQHSAMVKQAQSGAAQVDVYNLDVTWIAEFATAGYIRPLESADTTGFLDQPLGTCRIKGTLWALPFNTDAGLLYYRTDAIRANNLPRQLPPIPAEVDRMVAAVPSLKAAYVTQLASYEGLTVNALESIWSAGGDVVSAEGQVVIDSPSTRLALRQLAVGLNTSGEATPALLPASFSAKEKESTEAFASGSVALMRNWPVAYAQLQQRPDHGAAGRFDISQNFAVAALPGRSVLGGQDLAVATTTSRPRAAQALIQFLTSDDSERRLFGDGGLAATRGDVYTDPSVQAAQPYARLLRTAIDNARLRPVTPNYPLFSSVFQSIVRQALADNGNLPTDAVRRLTNALNGELG